MSDSVWVTIRDEKYLVVPKNQIFHPGFARFYYADELEEGMVVLVESRLRGDEKSSSPEYHQLLIHNRWCKVTRVREHNDELVFIGVYDDGSIAVRRSDLVDGWLVKKSSIPALSSVPMTSTSKENENG